jgi:ectoine hydroxylase-related dioxygenase (phytanoyl-CoA dioxygenase family)
MSNFITVWTPLVKIDEECGGVAVYRGSGNAPPLEMSSAGAVWFDGVTTEGYEKVHITCEVGDVLVMNNQLIHTSMPNRSDRTRISVDCRYFGSNGHSEKHYLDMQDWQVIAPAVGESNGAV